MEKEFIDFGHVPSTPYDVYKAHKNIKINGLYYTNEDGEHETPRHIWFSCDMRNWWQNPDLVNGRAMTTYCGKNGTTLTTIYKANGKPYIREDLCDVTAYYKNGIIYDFHHE